MPASAFFTGSYDYRLVALSVVISVIAAYVALDIAGRLTTARGKPQLMWLSFGAIAMGTGIWAMHYVGMEAFHLPVLVLYDWPTIVVSLLAAIFASAVALLFVSRPTMGSSRTIVGSLFMGGGIAAMHYIGMKAMRLPAMCIYSPGLVALSVLLAIGTSFVALRLIFSFRENSAAWGWRKFGASIVMGLAIPIVHYVGMAAVSFAPTSFIHGSLSHAVSVSSLGLACIMVATLVILGLVLLTSVIDRRFSQQRAESQLQLQTIFDKMTEGIIIMGRDGRIIASNKIASQIFSIPDKATFFKSVANQHEAFTLEGVPVPPDQGPAARALCGDFVLSHEFVFRNKATGRVDIREITTALIGGKRRELDKIILTSRDTTERRRVDEARIRLAAIVESSDDAIIGKDTQGIVTSWNRGAEKIFGYSAEEMVGLSITRLLPPDREREEDEILSRIRRDESVDHFGTTRKTKDGRIIHVSLTISPIKDASGKVVGASKIARDVTETRNLERQLHQSQKMEAIGQLTGGIAHDFNNLLGVILGNLDLLELLVPDNEVALRRVHAAQKASMRSADLTRRLLAFSRKDTLRPTSTLLGDAIQNVIEFAARALGPNIKITSDLDPLLPPVFVDVAGLESALLNLAVNARDAMPKGGSLSINAQLTKLEAADPPVQAGELKQGSYARVSLSDTGHGMSREVLEHVFEPFFTTKPADQGTGLGLAMVYGFVKQSGGTVRIDSELGSGTTVSLYLPLADPESHAQSATSPVAGSGLSAKRGGSVLSVLVVDDDELLREITVAYVTLMGYTPFEAKDGASALEVLARHAEIDLIVTDILMPGGMNGAELAQRVLKSNPAIKVIYCSGFHPGALERRSMPLVDGPLLRKPYQRAEFSAMICQVMGGESTNS